MQDRKYVLLGFFCLLSGMVVAETAIETERMWKQEAKPQLNFFELDGYLRTRVDVFNRCDLGTDVPGTGGTSSCLPPLQYFGANPDVSGTARPGWLLSSNMRLRLDPTLNVSEDIRVRTTLDLMDNLVLGSTPNYMTGLGFPNPSYPYAFLSMTQNAPIIGINNAWGPINLKRVWGEVTTPVGELRFGRMPMHFGLGLLYNAGNLETNDYGDNIDGVMFATRVLGHYFIPGFSISYTGATGRSGGYTGQPYRFVGAELGQRHDLDPSDNVYSFFLTFAKKDKDIDAKILLSEGKTIVNYGALATYRFQINDSMYTQQAADNATPEVLQKQLLLRNAQAGFLSLWGDIRWDRLRVEAEAVGILGHIGSSEGLWSDALTKKDPLWVLQGGAAIKSRYGFLNDRLVAGLDAGWASGDQSPVFGARPGSKDPSAGLSSFRFSPDYRVDMLLFRQIAGTVNSAFYLRPHIGYNFTDSFGLRADVISSATPSSWLGLEIDASLFYRSDDGFHVSLQYGFLVPFSGLNNPNLTGQNLANFGTASTASAIQLFAGIVF